MPDREGGAARQARELGDRIFLPVLTIPAVTFVFALAFRSLGLDANRGALVGLGYGSVLAMLMAVRLTRSNVRTLMAEGRRLNELMGSVNILPQLLASLGVIFTAAKVGDFIAGGIVQPGARRTTCSSSCSPTASAWRCSPWCWATPSRPSR